ncbi:MAG: DUF692 family protein [Thiolinea sp.]
MITSQFLQPGTVQQDYLQEVAAHYPLSFHGVGLSLGSADALDHAYVRQLRNWLPSCSRCGFLIICAGFGGAWPAQP